MPEVTEIDRLIDPAIKKVSKSSYFRKSEVVNQVLSHGELAKALRSVDKSHAGWNLSEIVHRYVYASVGHALQQKDSNGIRVYECYAAGESERRWMRLRAMTARELRLVIQETRTRERQMVVKRKAYEVFLDELEKLEAGTKIGAVYDDVVAKIRKVRSAA
jgi:hypothetical protein